MRRLALLALAATLLTMFLLCACAANSGATPTPGPAATPGSSASASPLPSSRGPAPSESPASEGQAAAVEAARRDAAQRLNAPPESLRVEDVESRQWPDRSLGCPRQGVLYAQVLTPGYLIVLSNGSRRLEYHTDNRGMAVFCQEQS